MFPATLRRNGEYSSPIRFAFNRSCSLFPILQFLVCFAVDYNFGAYSVWLQFNFNERMGAQGREMDEVGDGNTAGRNGNLVNIELTHYFQGFFEVKTGGNVIYISSLVWGAGSTGFQNIGLAGGSCGSCDSQAFSGGSCLVISFGLSFGRDIGQI